MFLTGNKNTYISILLLGLLGCHRYVNPSPLRRISLLLFLSSSRFRLRLYSFEARPCAILREHRCRVVFAHIPSAAFRAQLRAINTSGAPTRAQYPQGRCPFPNRSRPYWLLPIFVRAILFRICSSSTVFQVWGVSQP